MTCGATIFSFANQPLQAVGILLPRHQHGVLRRHHHEIVDAFQRHQRLVGRDVAVAGILEYRRSQRGISLRILVRQFPHRIPGADIGPAAGDRHHRRARGLFHDRVVDRDRLRRTERLSIQRDEAEIAPCFGHGVRDRLHACGIDLAVLVEQNGGAEHEVAAVPEIAGLDVVLGGRLVRLLDEFGNAADLAGHGFARADVAVFGRRALRLDAEGHDAPALGGDQPLATGSDKGWRIADDVIGRQRQHHRLVVARLRESGAGGDRRTRIPPHRLQQHVRRDADFGELFQHHEAVGRIGDDDRTLEQGRIRHPLERVLKGRARAEQRQELLGAPLARGRPQPRPGAAAHDQWNNSSVHRALPFYHVA